MGEDGGRVGVGLEEKYRKAEWWAKLKRVGMWKEKKGSRESPRQYKTRHRLMEALEDEKDGW